MVNWTKMGRGREKKHFFCQISLRLLAMQTECKIVSPDLLRITEWFKLKL